jgi:hypothetical protein
MIHWKTFLALCAVLVPIQAATLAWAIRNESRLTRIETIIELRLRPEGATPSGSAERPQAEARNLPSH